MTEHLSPSCPLRHFLFSAFYQWMLKNQWTPLLLASLENLSDLQDLIPMSKNGRITLDLAPDAVDDVSITEVGLSMICYFDGEPRSVELPLSHLLSLVAAENGRGISFEDDGEDEEIATYLEFLASQKQHQKPKTSHLKIVKTAPKKDVT